MIATPFPRPFPDGFPPGQEHLLSLPASVERHLLNKRPVSPAAPRPTTLAAVAATASLLIGSPLWLHAGVALAVPPVQRLAVDDPAIQDAYIIGPGDQLQLTLLDPGVSNLSGTLDILNDGSASLALLGSVVLEGLTLNQATNWLRTLYGRYLLRPDLNLRIARPRPIQVSLVGEVENPGLYSLTSGEDSRTEVSSSFPGLPTLVTAIQKAGGLTLNADVTSVVLKRRVPGRDESLRETKLNLATLLQQGDKYQNPFLFDGDTIIVDKASLPDPAVMELAATNLSPQRIQVNVVGEVVRPGPLQVKASTPLVEAILAAGGPRNWRANRGNVELVRINRNGTATRQIFSVNYSQGVSGARNPPLRDGDTVVVNRSAYAAITDTLDAVTRPLSSLVNSWGWVRLIQNTNNN
jgi:polysaccharide biosynthesis/export protein